ncbi:MAG: hypothetical protein AUI11_11810 [Acidobacteria bacterium 13_2_20CM_2_66_4]|nr:MAG: hypothetical protein AUI11_11810 [Acidobacteria bacterium 13_2_20CM_2_66_4]
MRVVIAGGGTGGHLYPGIAVARELLARRSDAQVSFAGTARGIESRVVPREGFPLDLIRSGGLKGKSLADLARGASLLPLGLIDAWGIVSARRPDVVIGVGGYSSGPVVLVASLRGVPTMLLEQNAVPGLTNRLLARVVRSAAVTFDSTAAFFGSKAFVSGNPVRPEFLATAGSSQESAIDDQASGIRVLVFGGSQGAHAINVAMVEAAAQLAAGRPHLRLTHQTGERDLEMVRAAYGAAGVPLPTATDDHQRKNAEALAAKGAAEVLLQQEMTGAVLAERLLALAADRERRMRMSAAARSLARPDAARVIVDRALELVGR